MRDIEPAALVNLVRQNPSSFAAMVKRYLGPEWEYKVQRSMQAWGMDLNVRPDYRPSRKRKDHRH